MEKCDKKPELKARERVYRLLKYRLYSEHEIRAKLKEKKTRAEVIDTVISYFKELKLIDDRVFAQGWIKSRLNRPFGAKRIQFELKSKGVAGNIIEEELKAALVDYCEEDVVFDLAARRYRQYKGLEPEKIRARLLGYLSRRGFNSDAIFKALKKLQ